MKVSSSTGVICRVSIRKVLLGPAGGRRPRQARSTAPNGNTAGPRTQYPVAPTFQLVTVRCG